MNTHTDNTFIMENFARNKDFYEHCKPENKFRTYRRLKQIQDMGMTLTGEASFGIRCQMGGLYIEKVWGLDDKGWDEYIEWVKSVRIKTEEELRIKMYEEIEKYKTFASAISCMALARDYYLNVHNKKEDESNG